MAAGRYSLSNEAPQSGSRFAGLEAMLDPVTTRIVESLGVAAGSSCLEVGAGGGSVARWLADLVGPDGRVLATDVNLDWFGDPGRPNLEARAHDIVADELPEDAYDLVHARLVLVHLAEREAVIRRLVRSLRPGGWLLLEDYDRLIPACTHTPGDREHLVNRVRLAFSTFLERNGGDETYPRTLPWLLREVGMTNVEASGHVQFATGGSIAAGIECANLTQVGAEMEAAGLVRRDEVERYLQAMAEPDLIFAMPLLVSAWGSRG